MLERFHPRTHRTHRGCFSFCGDQLDHSCSDEGGAESIFRFTPDTTGQYLVWTAGEGATAGVDTVLSVFSACSLTATELACQDDLDFAGGNFLSGMYVDLTAGETVYIVVESFNDDDFGSAFVLEVDLTTIGDSGDACDSRTMTELCDWDRNLGCVWSTPLTPGPGSCESVGTAPVIINVEEISVTLGHTPSGAEDDRCAPGDTYDVATYRLTAISNEDLVIWSFQAAAFGVDPFFFLLSPPAEPGLAGFAVTEQDLCFGVGDIPSGPTEPVSWSVMDNFGERGFVQGMSTFDIGGGETITGRFSETFTRTY